MIIEIKDDGNGAWNLTAKSGKDAWPPLYMAYGRSVWATTALVRGVLTDFDQPDDARPATEHTEETRHG